MKVIIKSLVLLLILSYKVLAQNNIKRCYSSEFNFTLVSKNKEFQNNISFIEQSLNQITNNKVNIIDTNTLYIPVVFHIVYKNNKENISDEKIISQIDALNRDFGKNSYDTSNIPLEFREFAADMNIQFYLTRFDENGNNSLGITRTETTIDTFTMDDNIKYSNLGGKDAWDTERFLNIWVGNLSETILGYAQVPGGPKESDGVVLSWKITGTIPPIAQHYDLGKSATHEIGHWLNLKHLWGDSEENCNNTDFVEDTPSQLTYNQGCPDHPSISCSNNGDMFMNYMDYTFDKCMFMFTNGQKQRIRNSIRLARPKLIENLSEHSLLKNAENYMVLFPNPTKTELNLFLRYSINEECIYTISNITGKTIYISESFIPNINLFPINIKDLKLDNGVYFLTLYTSQNSFVQKFIII